MYNYCLLFGSCAYFLLSRKGPATGQRSWWVWGGLSWVGEIWYEPCTLHMQCGCALVHGKHVGAGAHIDACISGLYVADGQDAVEIHGTRGQPPIVLTGPHQGVGRGL